MGCSVDDIEGIGTACAEKRRNLRIATTGDLLAHGGAARGRKDVAGAVGLSERLLLAWTTIADLMRRSGVGREHSELFEAAGVNTNTDLRRHTANDLAEVLATRNETNKLARRVPGESEITVWIEHAKTLEPSLSD